MPPSFKAAANVAKGLNVEPGCLNVLVARFKVRLEDFSPLPPTIAFTYPVCWSMMVIED